jgi:hypothetical protein
MLSRCDVDFGISAETLFRLPVMPPVLCYTLCVRRARLHIRVTSHLLFTSRRQLCGVIRGPPYDAVRVPSQVRIPERVFICKKQV